MVRNGWLHFLGVSNGCELNHITKMLTMKKKSTSIILIVCVVLFIGFVALACLSGAWPSTDFAAQILSALAGAVVAAIITLFLLQGQMASEEKKEKNSKIFEEKLRIYQDFMQELCEVVKDQKIDEEEEIRLQFQVASIAMHTNEDSILEISCQVKDIISNIKDGEDDKKEMLSQLFVISDIFHKELYKDASSTDEKKRMRTIQNFKLFLVKDSELDKYEEDCKKEIIEAYKDNENLGMEERIILLKSKIPSNGSKQWIYQNNVLVHDYYTERGARGGYVKRGGYIGIDLTPIGDKLVLNVFSRSWNPEETLKIVQGIGEGNEIKNPYPEQLAEGRHVLQVFNANDPIDKIASAISGWLEKIKQYRDNNF